MTKRIFTIVFMQAAVIGLIGCQTPDIVVEAVRDESVHTEDDVEGYEDSGQNSGGAENIPAESQHSAAPACDTSAAQILLGTGTEADPYLICNYSQFLRLGQSPYRGVDVYSRLEADIAFEGVHTPLAQYFGRLDGNDHALTSVVVTATNGGIFRSLAGHIKNLRILAPEATVGVIGLDMIGTASMTRVDVIGGLVRSNQHVGGFFQESWGRIDDCTSTAAVETTGVGKYAGGIVAFIQWTTGNDSYILRSNADGEVRITTGGTAGRIAGSIISGNRLKDCDQARLQTSVGAMVPFGYNAGAASNCQ